jgi:hypothetical protein
MSYKVLAMDLTEKKVYENKKEHSKYVLNVLLEKRIENESELFRRLEYMHPKEIVPRLLKKLSEYVNNDPFVPGKIRSEIKNAPNDIEQSKYTLSYDGVFNDIQDKIVQGKIPDLKDLENKFGTKYAPTVRAIDDKLLELGLQRHCWTYNITHYHRVSGMAEHLGLDSTDYFGDFFHFKMLGFIHDIGEDLIGELKDNKGKVYGLNRVKEFENEFVDPSLVEHFEETTNWGDLIFKLSPFIMGKILKKTKHENQITEKDLLHMLGNLSEKKLYLISDVAEGLFDLFEHEKFVPGNVMKSAKWRAYFRFYQENLVNTSTTDKLKKIGVSNDTLTTFSQETYSDYRKLQVKGADTRENNINMFFIDGEDSMKSIIKQASLGDKMIALDSKWNPLIRHANELIESSRKEAEFMICYNLSLDTDLLDHFDVAIKYMKALQSVLYEDKKPANIYEIKKFGNEFKYL